jgi:hypothetical protein
MVAAHEVPGAMPANVTPIRGAVSSRQVAPRHVHVLYRLHFADPRRERLFLASCSFLATFAAVRAIVRSIHAGVGPFRDVSAGRTHIHHLVWGILLLLTMGYLGIAADLGSPWEELVAILFGIGMGLTLDEFALWLNLEDVYWQAKGRQSIDAVIVATSLLVIALLGLQFWIDVWDAVLVMLGFDRGSSWIAIPIQVVGVALALVCFRRGRKLAGLFGLFVPLVALIGAVVPARSSA